MALIVFQDVSAGLAIMAAALFMMAGWGMTYLAFQIKLRRMAEGFRRELREMERRVNAGHSTDASTEKSEAPSTPAAARATISPARVEGPAVTPTEVAPEELLVIAAAVTAFLGKKVRIRSAQMLQTPYEIINPWSQQGRVIVQASHNLNPRGHRE